MFVHPGSPAAIRFIGYPPGPGRTFEGRSGSRTFDALDDGGDLVVTLTAADTTALAGRHEWTLLETTVGEVVRVRGDLIVEPTTTAQQTTSVVVTAEEIEVSVSLTEPGDSHALDGGSPGSDFSLTIDAGGP